MAVDTALASLVFLGVGTNSTLGYGDQITLTADQAGALSRSTVAVGYSAIDPTSLQDFSNSSATMTWDQGGAGYVGTLTLIAPPNSLTGMPQGVSVELLAYNGNGLPAQDGGLLTTIAATPLINPAASGFLSSATPATDLAPFAPAEPLLSVTDGSPPIIGYDLANGAPAFSTGAALAAITYVIANQSNTGGMVPDRRLTVLAGSLGTANLASPPVPIEPELPPPGGSGASGNGDVHLTTFDGLHYDFQAAGEFVLARSTTPGGSYQVQIRLQPWYNSATVSVMTEIGAAVGSHRVTFDVNRANPVWVDGAPAALASGTPYQLGAGTLQQLAPNSWEIQWNTDPGPGYVSAGNFSGDSLPTGSVTLEAGATIASFGLGVIGSLGTLPVETLAVSIATPGSLAIAGPTALVAIENATPVAGLAALPEFLDPAAIGTLSGSATDQTLALGTFALGQAVGGIPLDIANGASGAADTLSGLIFQSGSPEIGIAGGLGPVVGLTAGAIDPLSLAIATGTSGSLSSVLTLAASQSNQSGYQASLGDYRLTITAAILPESVIAAPPQVIVPPDTGATLGGIAIQAAASYAGDPFSVTLSDTAGILAIADPGFVSVAGDGGTSLTLSGSLAAIDQALGSIDFTGTGNDILTIAASFAGGGTATDTLGVIVDRSPTLSAPGSIFGLAGEPWRSPA